jgi:hypothetical protein
MCLRSVCPRVLLCTWGALMFCPGKYANMHCSVAQCISSCLVLCHGRDR